jgi:hypothetical protein
MLVNGDEGIHALVGIVEIMRVFASVKKTYGANSNA